MRSRLVAALAFALVLGPAWSARAEGFTISATLRNAAYHLPDAPDVMVHAPADFDPRAKLDLVVYLHGYSGCLGVLMGDGPSRCRPSDPPQTGWNLGARHDDAKTNTLLIVPQLAFMKQSGRPGAFRKPGVFRAFLTELLGETLVPQLGGPRTLADVASLTLVAHSAGYETALAVLEHGEVAQWVHALVLLDALYGEEERYERFILAHAGKGSGRLRVVALHLGYGATQANDLRLHRRLLRVFGPRQVAWVEPATLEASLATHALVIGTGVGPHRQVPEHHLAQILRALAVPLRP